MSQEGPRSTSQLLPFRHEVEADEESDEINPLLDSNGDAQQLRNKVAFVDDVPGWREYVQDNRADVLTLLGVGLVVSEPFSCTRIGI